MKKISILLMAMILLFTGCSDNNSVGIIGGADGPTAIFMTSSINWLYIAAFIAIIVIILAVIIYIKCKKDKKLK